MHRHFYVPSFYHKRERGDILNTCQATDAQGKCWRHAEEVPYMGLEGLRWLCKMHWERIEDILWLFEMIREGMPPEAREWPRMERAS